MAASSTILTWVQQTEISLLRYKMCYRPMGHSTNDFHRCRIKVAVIEMKTETLIRGLYYLVS